MPERRDSYFGSVRFFKNLILLAVIIAIAVPTVISIRRGSQLNEARAEVDSLKAEVTNLSAVQEPVQPSAPVEEEEEQEPLGEAPAYQELFPDFYAPNPVSANEYSDKTIYLTFDDGPSENTDEILATLEEYGVKATFFVMGPDNEAARQGLRDIVDAGHTLAMHTYSHDYAYLYASVESYLEDMYRIFTMIQEATGVTPAVFRFPGGSINGYNFGMSQELIAEMLRRGFVPYDWNLSAEDSVNGSTVPVQRVMSNVLNSAPRVNRGFILMHDSPAASTTPDALGPMIEQLREMGFSFAPITERVKPVLFNYQ